MAACGGSDETVSLVGEVKDFSGMIAADEPQAALVGRDALMAGGSAADAAAAMAFALSVTLPSQAGLGAGGVCMVDDHDKGKTEVLDFIPADGSQVPALPRAMFALQSKYGRLRWERVITPAEGMARFGAPISRAFAQQLLPAAATLSADPDARRIFARADGSPYGEGDTLVQSELGTTLAKLRSRGVGDFYNGAWAADIAAAARAAGGSLTAEQMRSFAPQWKEPIAVKYGENAAYFPPPPAAGGVLEAELWAALVRDRVYADTDDEVRPHLLAEAYSRLIADRQYGMQSGVPAEEKPTKLLAQDRLAAVLAGGSDRGPAPAKAGAQSDAGGGTAFVAMDANGSVVACTLGLNGSFGAGHMARGTGMMLAAPAAKGAGSYGVAPMVALNVKANRILYAAAASGGPAAATAMSQVALSTLLDGQPLERSLAAKRIHAVADQVVVEPGDPAAAVLSKRGHQLQEGNSPARLDAVACGAGGGIQPSNCSVASDPRGYGLALVVGKP